MSSPDRIAEHDRKWDALPPFPDYPYVMTEDDVEFWSDLLYLQALADAIEDQEGLTGAQLVRAAATPAPSELPAPWPHDHAADMLAAWNDGDWPDEYTDTSHRGRAVAGAQNGAPGRSPRWWRRTFHKRTLRRILVALSVAVVVGTGIAAATVPAKASPNPANGDGCERINWGLHFLTPQKRTICDGPRRADGSWERWRQLWTPAHYVPARSYCSGTYYISCSTSGGYFVDDQVWEEMTYVVFDSNVLEGEPGWLPAGTAVLR